VSDFANVLDPATEAQLEALIHDVDTTTSAELAVVTVRSLEGKTVEEYAVDLFNAWGIGKKGTNNGVLILISPADRAMRIEVGYGLEPILPDGLAGEIIRKTFLPRFRTGDYDRGILEGVTRVAAVVRAGVPADASSVSAVAEEDDIAPWLVIPFLGLFVAGGSFGAGVGMRAKTSTLLIVGVIFSVLPLLLCLTQFPRLGALTLFPLMAAMATLGHSKAGARKWLVALRGTSNADTLDWVASSPNSSSSGDGSSSDSFSGGSSGGGGASGHW